MTIDRSVDDESLNLKRQYLTCDPTKKKRRGTDITTYYRCFQNYYHSQQYLMPNPEYAPRVAISVHHWQLRDLIRHNGQDDVLYISKDSVRAYNERNHVSRMFNHAKFYPRCLDVGSNGAVLIGGLLSSVDATGTANISCLTLNLFNNNVGDNGSVNGNNAVTRGIASTFHRGMVTRMIPPYSSKRTAKGLLTYYNPETNIDATYRLGDMINNDVMLHQRSDGHLRAYACNNDTRLYGVDIQSSGKMNVIQSSIVESNTSINSVISNPMFDKLLTVSGDSSNIHLLDTNSPKKIKCIKTSHDSGFGMAYHPNNVVFATCFQDGFCSLYDIRNLDSPLTEIKSTRQGHQLGAFRCCKFSSLSIENMLVILEHIGRVHVIDLNDLENKNHQVIVLPQALVQYAEYRNKLRSCGADTDTDIDDNDNENVNHNENHNTGKNDEMIEKHHPMSVYDALEGNFSAPLVYDYDYLVNVNPKLFKNYNFPTSSATTTTSSYSVTNLEPQVDFVLPQWYGTPGHPHVCEDPELSPTTPLSATQYTDPTNTPITSVATPMAVLPVGGDDWKWQLSQYQMNGETELAGLDWHNNKIYIGHQEGGIMTWEVNATSLRSRGCYAFA